jgi:septum formation protein
MSESRKLILASASPRRRELVPLLGFPWAINAVDVDETIIDHPDPAENVMKTSELKAIASAKQSNATALILAADTTVVLDGLMLNKPQDTAEAGQMLRDLRNRVHQVYTGITIIDKAASQHVADVAMVDVPMRNYSDSEIEAYLRTGDPLDKAGAYAIQHSKFRPVINFSGCYAAVVGLPLCHVARTLYQTDAGAAEDVAAKCQDHHNYDCPVFKSILEP